MRIHYLGHTENGMTPFMRSRCPLCMHSSMDHNENAKHFMDWHALPGEEWHQYDVPTSKPGHVLHFIVDEKLS